MSQAQLAEKIGVTRQTISSWERGASFPDIKMLEDLSSAFDIEIWGGGLIAIPLFKKLVGGGITEDFIIVVYWGLILLVAYPALCMCLISEYISGRRDDDTVDNSEN